MTDLKPKVEALTQQLSAIEAEGVAGTISALSEALKTGEGVADAYAGKLKRLEKAVLFGPGVLDPAVRKVASVAGELPGVPGSYVKKVWRRAHEITSEDVAALRQIGYSEDQIFELTVSAALGAGLARLQSALSARCSEHSPRSSETVIGSSAASEKAAWVPCISRGT